MTSDDGRRGGTCGVAAASTDAGPVTAGSVIRTTTDAGLDEISLIITDSDAPRFLLEGFVRRGIAYEPVASESSTD